MHHSPVNASVDSSGVTNRLTIFLCVLAALCEGIDLQAAGVAAAGIGAELKPTAQQMGTFFSASTMGLFLGALVGGRLSDSLGRKTVLVNSIAIFGLCSLLTALATDVLTLTGARLLTGIGLGGALPNLIALVSESSAGNRRSANVALVYSGTPFGGAVISLVSSLTTPDHWRWIFIIGGVVPLIIAPIMAIYLQESVAFKAARATVAAAPNSAPRGLASFTAVFNDGRATRTLLLWVSFFLGLLTLYLLLNWLPTLLLGMGLSAQQAGFAQIGFNIGGAAAALLIGRVLEGPWRRMSVVFTFIALPILLLMLAQISAPIVLVIGIVLMLGCAVMASQAFFYAMAPACYPTLIRGVGVGLAVAMGRVGSIVGPKLGGVLKGAGYSSSQLLMWLLPIVVLGSICAMVLVRYWPKEKEV